MAAQGPRKPPGDEGRRKREIIPLNWKKLCPRDQFLCTSCSHCPIKTSPEIMCSETFANRPSKSALSSGSVWRALVPTGCDQGGVEVERHLHVVRQQDLQHILDQRHMAVKSHDVAHRCICFHRGKKTSFKHEVQQGCRPRGVTMTDIILHESIARRNAGLL
eukprot:CAMPEP_0170569436 /NCGR_PEP_ID=MMETSP0224-20130122/546_1 /TAXON_ID=285029 /ORGANISM="Togula jolla, Strain CCCM 725" /LENGTH=161 /DNA_ID=CAMNT_0010891587 /DNA_START=364 /DNA_END=849 /DNA_ORIENTATION=+